MSKATSPYYPPRARWYAPIFYITRTARLGIAFDHIQLPAGANWLGIFAALVVPGLGFWLRGPRILGRAAMAACVFLFAIFIVWIGYPIANIAFGLMVSMHVSGVVYYCNSFMKDWEILSRILFTVLLLLSVGFLIYTPLRNTIQNRWLMPVRQNGHLIVVTKSAPKDKIRRGDTIAYMLSGYYFSNHMGNNPLERSWLGLGPVLAVTGDTVTFSTNRFTVNGVSQRRLAHMPLSGTFVVQTNHWFIWPMMDFENVRGDWRPQEDQISSAMLQLSSVSQGQYVGKPLKRWFWREQIVQ